MKSALLCALLLATAALATSCCSSGDDIITVALDSSAGIHDHEDKVFPQDCQPPVIMVPDKK